MAEAINCGGGRLTEIGQDNVKVVGMDKIKDLASQELPRLIPQNVPIIGTQVGEANLGIGFANQVRGVLDQLTEALFAFAQTCLGFTVLSNVRDPSIQSELVFVAVSAGSNAVANPADGAVGTQNSILCLFAGGMAALDPQDRLVGYGAVIMVDNSEPSFRTSQKIFRRPTRHLFHHGGVIAISHSPRVVDFSAPDEIGDGR